MTRLRRLLSRRQEPWRRDRSLCYLDRQLERHCRGTMRDVRREVAPYVRVGEGLASLLDQRVPRDERDAVRELLQRVDLGPGGQDADLAERLYDLLDDLAGGRR